MRPIVVREGDELRVPAELDGRRFRDRLKYLSDTAQVPIFHFHRHAIRVAAVVGTVTCGEARIEIRPKAAGNDANRDRRFLLNLLRFSGYLQGYHAMPGRVTESDADPIEVLIAEIARDIENGLRHGVPRRYELRDMRAPTIRGAINFTRLSTLLPSDQTLLPVRYAPLTRDNRVSRLVKATSKLLLSMTRSVVTRERLTRALSLLHDVDDRGILADAERLSLSRFESNWQRTLMIARLLSRRRSFDPTTAGSKHAIAFVFALERLFERSLRRVLPSTLVGTDLTVTHHTDELYMLESMEGGEVAVRIRPDFVYRRGVRAVAVADAKWKVLAQNARAYGVSTADLYQIGGYLMRYKIADALLFFPKTEWMPDRWLTTYKIPQTELRIHFVGVDIEALVSGEQAVRVHALEALAESTHAVLPNCDASVTTSS